MEGNNEVIPMNKAYFGKSEKRLQYIATISVCLAALSAGTVLAWSSPAITELSAEKSFNNSHQKDGLKNMSANQLQLTKNEEALLGSILNLGALTYAIPTGVIADRYGRKMAIYLCALSFVSGWFFIVIAVNVTMLLIGRFLGGMGLGAICVAAPMYIGEIAENSIRSTLSSYFQIFLSFGVFVTFTVGSMTNYVTMSVFLAIFPIILLCSFPFVPESYVYLMKIGRIKEAEKSLTRFRGDSNNYDIRGEMETIQREIKNNCHQSRNICEIVSNKSNRNGMISVLGMLTFQQLCGVNAITFYTEQIFAEARDGLDPSIGAIIMGALQCLGGFLSIVFIERAGRKYLLILSSMGMMTALCIIAIFFHVQYLRFDVSKYSLVPIFSAALFILAFTIAYGSIPYMMMHELLSPEIRGIGSGVAIVVCWVTSFLITYSFPLALANIGNYTTFYILTAINAVAIVFVIYFVPETKGKTLIEIQELLGK